MPNCYAAFSKNKVLVEKSSSGGIFCEIARSFLEGGGIVFGCALINNKAEHIEIDSINDLPKILKSKYIQSNVTNIFNVVKQSLLDGKNVLFSGTPCQIFALKNFLKCDYNNLYTVDIICHGVPSYKVWQKYVIDEKIIGQVDFRNKDTGWENFSFKYGSKIENIHQNLYMRAFLENYSLNDSCYSCKFKGENRCSDITLGNFWGIKDEYPDFYNDMGVSLLIIRKREDFYLNLLKDNCEVKEVELSKAVSHNSAYLKPVDKPFNAKKFKKAIKKNKISFKKIVNLYCKITIFDKILYKIRSLHE